MGRHSSIIPSNKGLGPLLDGATNPTKTIIHQITLLSWVTPQEVQEYQKKIEDQLYRAGLCLKKKKRSGNLMTFIVTTPKQSWKYYAEIVVSTLPKHRLVSHSREDG